MRITVTDHDALDFYQGMVVIHIKDDDGRSIFAKIPTRIPNYQEVVAALTEGMQATLLAERPDGRDFVSAPD